MQTPESWEPQSESNAAESDSHGKRQGKEEAQVINILIFQFSRGHFYVKVG
jgi:hypothetical protein